MSGIKLKQRIIINTILLVYWLPAVIVDVTYPTRDEYKIITNYLPNWNQILILLHLIIAVWFDSMHIDFETSKNFETENVLNETYSCFKIMKNQIAQITIDISVLVSLNFIILHLCYFKLELTSHKIHENFNTLIIIFISYSVSDIEIRICDVLPSLAFLWLFIVHNFVAYLRGVKFYPFVPGSNENSQDIFILVVAFLLSVEITLIHFVIYFLSVLKKETSETEKLSDTSFISA